MSPIETLQKRIHREKPRVKELRWTTEKSLERLLLLQGQTVNLIPVLQKNVPDHAHYTPDSFPKQQQEPKSLRRAILSHGTEKHREKEKLYEDYFKRQGIKTQVVDGFIASSGDRIWPAKKATALFSMIDFSIHFRIPIDETSGILLFVNTTKVEGDLYKIGIPDFPNAEPGERKDNETALKNLVTHSGMIGREWDPGKLILEETSHRLIADLLAARV